VTSKAGELLQSWGDRLTRTRTARPVLYSLLAVMLATGIAGATIPHDTGSHGPQATGRSGTSQPGSTDTTAALGGPNGSNPGGSTLPTTVQAGGSQATGGRTGANGSVTTKPGTKTTTPGSSGGSGGGGSKPISNSSVKIGIIIPAGNPGGAAGVPLQYDANGLTKVVQAIVDETNATGGLGGRQVEVVYAYNDNTNQEAESQTREQNRICTQLTEDAKVFMAFNFNPLGVDFAYDCFAAHHTPVLDTPLALESDQQRLDEMNPWLVLPLSLNFSRMAKLLPVALRDQGYMTQKMAVVGIDLPPLKRTAQKVLVPAIEAAGGKVVQQVYLAESYSAISAGIANAVLTFSQQGIDRVVFWGPGGGLPLLFGRQADSQGYRPRYGMTTYDAPALTQTLLPASQLHGAVGVGFVVQGDLADTEAPPLNDREKACFAVEAKRAGMTFTARRQSTAAGLALGTCEFFGVLKAALADTAGKPLAPNEVAPHVYALGTSYVPVTMTKARYGPGRPDGATAYSRLAYNDACSCFKYASGWLDSPF
jgi:ABC-type branched-subunit amino acid transport system substrate-binding protein